MYTFPIIDDYSPWALDRVVHSLLAAIEDEIKTLQTEEDWRAFRDRWMARKNSVLAQATEALRLAPKEAKRE